MLTHLDMVHHLMQEEELVCLKQYNIYKQTVLRYIFNIWVIMKKVY